MIRTTTFESRHNINNYCQCGSHYHGFEKINVYAFLTLQALVHAERMHLNQVNQLKGPEISLQFTSQVQSCAISTLSPFSFIRYKTSFPQSGLKNGIETNVRPTPVLRMNKFYETYKLAHKIIEESYRCPMQEKLLFKLKPRLSLRHAKFRYFSNYPYLEPVFLTSP